MTATIKDSTGATVGNICINEMFDSGVSRYAVLDIPGANYDIVQALGNKNKTFEVNGWGLWLSGSSTLQATRTALHALKNTTGSIASDDIPSTQVLYHDVQTREVGGKIYEFVFKLSCQEVIDI